MTIAFDQHGINDMIVAVSREMTPHGGKRHADADTLFIGGTHPSEADQTALATFGLNKNYKVVFPSFDTTDVQGGPIGYHAVITDGLTQAITMSGGRLWKRDRSSAAILLFSDAEVCLRLNARGQLIVRGMTARYHDHGYDLARDAVLARASHKPGTTPVLSSIGDMVTVLDMQTMAAMFAAAE